jgi:hypothetical protein
MTAASSMIEALVYSCRQGPQALDRPDNMQRLRQLDERQLQEVHDRVQRFRDDLQYEGKSAGRWSSGHADALLDKWNFLNG